MKILKTLYSIIFTILSIPFMLITFVGIVGLWVVINLLEFAFKRRYVPLNEVLIEYGFTNG